MKKILPFFSYLFHPIFIPILGTLFYIVYSSGLYSKEQYFLLLFQVIIITFFLPLSFFYLLRTFGKVDSIMLSDASQRKIPLLMQIALTIILISKSVTIERFPELYYFFLGGIVSTVIAFILIYFKIKASVHMIALSALSFFVIGISMHNELNIIYSIAMLFLLSGLVASSRLAMKAHSVNELVIGYISGMIPQMILWYFWL
ncbi:hypothetical protein OX283_005420 [Flavobacterium sp. SUN052]|uniref:hypothetical protein n=1 Tax=Flavobacterium sp. SUN052 TaxID=3002441 RepID=UPI00237DE20A|nr:hypothetical protein [Flavobacterium sp. SUN052]MEC4004086.1 hypothetical protein [Flavobacterium sp. SUN052]